MASTPTEEKRASQLDGRAAAVLRAVVMAYVGEAAPIGSRTVSHILPMKLSPASIRNTLAQLTELGLLEKPHASAGRVPTDRGLRLFVDELIDPEGPAGYEQRTISYSVEEAETDRLVDVASALLSERTHQLGFAVAPRLDRVALRHVSLVRLSSERVMAVLVGQTGRAHRRVIDEAELDQAELDRVAMRLTERAAGRTLGELREVLAREARQLRRRADRVLAHALELGALALAQEGEVELVLGNRVVLLEQPEFHDPRRLRDLFETLETKQRLLEVVERMLAEEDLAVAFGDEVGEPGLHRCALVAARYGPEGTPLGALGVIGPSRMDFARVIPLVGFLSRAVTEKLSA